MLLNNKYYHELWNKYEPIGLVSSEMTDKLTILTIRMILEHCRNRKPVHFNFQFPDYSSKDLVKQLFIELSNEIYCKAADFPQLKIGDKVRSKTPIRVGAPKPRFLDFSITAIIKTKYHLFNEKHSFTWEKSYEELVEKFFPVTQRAQNETLTGFSKFFEKINGKQIYNFTPTYFDRKSVFIANKTVYDSLDIKNKIPTTYFPNSREEGVSHESKSIPALPDSIMYFVSKYKMCYDKLLLSDIKIDTIVVFDTELKEIEQIFQDMHRFKFNLIIISNLNEPVRYSQIPCWNWFKEEAVIMNIL